MMTIMFLLRRKSHNNIYTTNNDMNTIQELNRAQLHIEPETGEELPQTSPTETQLKHNYNLRKRPIK